MAEVKISELTSATTPLAGTETVPIVQGGVTKKVAVSNLGGSAAWGGITGTLSNQTDLNSALSGKQSTLVSGTNIKTINSTSLLGSGDLAINSVTGINSVFKPLTGRYQTQFVLGGAFDYNFYGAANFMQLAQYSPASTYTTTEMSVNCVSAVAGQEVKIVIYSDSNGTPSTNLLTSTALSFGTTGIKTYTVSFTFTAGTKYWVGIIQKTNGAAMMSGGYISYLSPIYTDNAFFTYNAISSTTYTYASPASTISLANFTGFNSNDSASFPLIIFKPA